MGCPNNHFLREAVRIKLMCISLYDVISSNWTVKRILMRSTVKLDGGAYRDRTDDPLLAKQVLSQLS